MKNSRRLEDIRNVVSGQPYIYVQVSLDGSMQIEHLTFHGQPFKIADEWVLRKKKCKPGPFGKVYGSIKFASTAGLIRGQHFNQHGLFRYTTENQKILSDLVERQALGEYLTHIGNQDPDATIERMSKQAAELGVTIGGTLVFRHRKTN